jgi:3'-phosphoadenosine 5'-phosphosulfate sulfotransferase (PAPS reductase)/FAD synthetase
MSKARHSIELIWRAIEESKRPAAMLSFGKDSMVLADLIRTSGAQSEFPRVHGFPIDVIYHRDPWFSQKHEFAEHVIKSWGMEVHDYPPMAAGVKVKPDMLELVARYNFGHGAMDIPRNVLGPEEYPRRDYICGLNDWLLRPKSFLNDYVWDTVFVGHKNADIDPFEGPVPLKGDEAELFDVRMVFPLRHWTDDDLWDYIEEHHIPVQETRYQGRTELEDKWYNNDYVHACTRCVDPREMRPNVFCPKLKRDVRNRGAEVLQLRPEVPYIDRKVEA